MRDGQRRFGVGGRLGLLALACLVLLSAAVPVMADPAEPEPPAPGQPVMQASEYPTPDPAGIGAVFAAERRKEEEREAELEEQPFVAQREASRQAYSDDSPAEAEELLRSSFPETFAHLNDEPARLLGEVKLDKNLGHGSALVTVGGKTQILEAGLPIEAANPEGKIEKVDLSLERGPEGFEPENPVTEVSIGATAEEGVEVGEEGLSVTQVGAQGSRGRLLGDKNVFFGEVEEGGDTDLMVSPTAHGAELFDLLRSADSPDTLRFKFELPEGDHLREGKAGGAEVVDPEGAVVALVPAPHAEDAQGTKVPVELAVEGDSVVLRTHHREEDLDYPILVDPEVFDNWGWWYQGQNLQGRAPWGFQTTIPQAHYEYTGQGQWPGWSGLFIDEEPTFSGGGSWAEWYLNSPNTNVYLKSVQVNPFQRIDECPQYYEPYDFAGYWNPATGNYDDVKVNDARNQGWYGVAGDFDYQFAFGLKVDQGIENECWRDLAAGGVSFYMGEWVDPNLVEVNPVIPSGWMTANTPFQVYLRATDAALGIKEVAFTDPGESYTYPVRETVGTRPLGCAGTYENPCPHEYAHNFNLTGGEFEEGEIEVHPVVKSPTYRTSPQAHPFTLKIDIKPPELSLSGQFETAVKEGAAEPGEGQKPGEGGPELTEPIYNLKVAATDGKLDGNPTDKQSGVKKVEVLVDGVAKPPLTNASCPNSSCPLGGTVPLVLTGLTPGVHHLKVSAYDFAGNQPTVDEQEFEYFPATGLTEEDVTQRFLLPDGKNHGEGSYQGPELAVNVMNGNVVYHQRDVDVEGPDTDLEVERFYNSQLPKSQSSGFGTGWTLSQTPSLVKAPSTNMATALTSESQLAGNVALPQAAGQANGHFSEKLGAYIEKEADGDYAVSEEGGKDEPATVYDAEGRAIEEQTSPTAAVEYAYQGGALSEISVDDPGSTTSVPPPVKKAPSIVPNYVSSFGSSGTGNGQLSHPADVALDAKGDEWVVDSGNNRIEEFSPGGEFIKSLGATGTGNGQFTTPKSLAFDSSSDLWVLDSGNSRLEEFGPTGAFVRAVGTKGTGNGQFNRPEGLAISPSGNILVSDVTGGSALRLVELGPTGGFIKAFTPAEVGMIEPGAIDIGPEGRIWIADQMLDRVVELSESGELIRAIGNSGTGEEEFRAPDAIAVGALGEVWVGDVINRRVEELTKEGSYVTQFGLAGSGPGQLSLSAPMGIATDNEGSLFVTDTNDNRVEHWQIPHFGYKPVYASSFGSTGSGVGQFRHPAGDAVDGQNHVWVPDVENNRIQELNQQGEVIGQLGSAGTGNGQFKGPKSIAFTPEADFWVADSGNSRLEEFNPKGEFVKAVGSAGSGNGQFQRPEGVAVAPDGNIWVADTYNYRIVELDEEGNFIKVVNPPGLEHIEPTSIAFGPGGNAWITDWAGNRVVEISPGGELIRQIGGITGSGNGQFRNPDAVAIDPRGIVYVVDQTNSRVQVFNQAGEYLTQFGSAGSGAGQLAFGYPTGIAADDRGNLWVADSDNNRIEKWQTGSWVPAEEEVIPAHDDPSVEVKSGGGLVTSVVGAEAGSNVYGHSGQLLTSDAGPEGTTKYEYEASQRLKKITLPNGTTASIVYDSTGRALEVTVTPAGGSAKTTKFSYVQETELQVVGGVLKEVAGEARSVTVEPVGEKRTFYIFDNAGDLIKSWNTQKPPTFRALSGAIYVKGEKTIAAEKELGIGGQNLFVEGEAAEGVKTIEIIVNGSTIVDEKTCPGTRTECKTMNLDWNPETPELPPGTMTIEAVLTNFVGESAARSWWVTVPYIPPPAPGVPEPPKYKEVLEFREARGLDLDLNPITDELELQARVTGSINSWFDAHSPEGEVAFGAYERWGVPLRQSDVEELEYREAYNAHDVPLIEAWGKSQAPSTFAGVYLDERSGGILRVGFTSEQPALEEALRSGAGLMAPGRVGLFTSPPARSLADLEGIEKAIEGDEESYPDGLIVSLGIDVAANTVSVGATNVAEAESLLRGSLGAGAPITVVHSEPLQVAASWQNEAGPILSGEYVRSGHGGGCSAGLGAVRTAANGTRKYFLLSAAHCGDLGQSYHRFAAKGTGHEIGKVARSGWGPSVGVTADGEAIAVETSAESPTRIDLGSGGTWAVDGSAVPPPRGNWLCHVGARTQARLCGPVIPRKADDTTPDGRHGRLICFESEVGEGDSGAPVWIDGTHTVVGLVSAFPISYETKKEFASVTCFTALKPTAGLPTNEGILTNQEMIPLQLRTDN
jgi:YD repeat-containing protein